MDLKKDPLKSFLMAADFQQKRRTSPFMQFFQGGKCTLCSREFRGLKASNGKRHLEMKHPVEYQQIVAQKRAGRVITASGSSTANRSRGLKGSKLNSMVTTATTSTIILGQHAQSSSLSSTIGSSTDDDDGTGSTDDVVLIVDSPPPPSASTTTVASSASSKRQISIGGNEELLQNRSLELIDDEIKRCVIALEAAARPLRRLSLFAGTFGIAADFIENKHFCELFQNVTHVPLPTPLELEHQINLEISDILLRIHRLLNSLSCGFCVSADVIVSTNGSPTTSRDSSESTNGSARSSHSPVQQHTMGIVAHFWNEERGCADQAALDIIQLQDRPTLEFVAETLKHAFDKTELNATKIYRTIVESSTPQQARLVTGERSSAQFNSTSLRTDERNYSSLFVGSCASYRLRSTCDDVFSTDHEAVELREKTLIVLDRMAKSPTALEQWRQRTGNEFAFPTALNWHSISAVYEQLLGQANVLEEICTANEWTGVETTERNTMTAFLALSGMVEKFAERLEDDRQPTCSFLFPGLKQLLHELKTTIVKPRLSHVLRTALSSRFVDVLTTADEDGDPFYLTAALLNPTVSPLVLRTYEHVASRAIRTICIRILGKRNPLLQKIGVLSSPSAVSTPCTPPLTGFALGSAPSTPALAEDALDREIADYLRRFSTINTVDSKSNLKPFDFWQQESRRFELLSTVARSVLTVPATSRAARRLLSTMSDQQNGGREAWKRAILLFNDSFISI